MNPIDADEWYQTYGITKSDNDAIHTIMSPFVASNIDTAATAVSNFKICPLIVTDFKFSAPVESDYDSDTVYSTYFSD